MSLLAVQALGSFEANHAGQPVTGFPRRKTTALLVYLCLEQPGKMHQRDALAGLLWPDIPQEDARRNLRQCLYQLRQVLQDHAEDTQAHLHVSAQLVGLRTGELECDVTRFRQLCASGSPADLETALPLYRGEILAGFSLPDAATFEEWLFFQREEIQRDLKKALQSQLRLAEQSRQWLVAIEALRRLLALDPLDEDLHRALMQAYFSNGERRAALDQYATCRSILAAELGLAPQSETNELYQKLKTAPFAATVPVAPPPPALEPAPSHLPVQLTSFIGRESDVQTVSAILRRPDVHLLTLTGPGGIGKTRLGLEVAAHLEKEFSQGIYFIPLASTTDPELVGTVIAGALGIKENSGQNIELTLQQTLRHKQILLLLDNFEQIIEAAGLVENLLKAAPGLKILVTSRFVLKVYGENEYAVRPLALPDTFRLPTPEVLITYPAIALFCERARALRPDFNLTVENSAALVEICARLDGLPLALELVAARVKLFAPQALVSRLRNRLSLATGGPRTLPQRQQTLRGAIGWSYDLLDSTEKELFSGLAAFVGSCSLPAILEVCAGLADEDTLTDTLLGLVDKSLVRSLSGSNGEPRFGMLETIREFALESLEASEHAGRVYRAHALFYTRLSESAEPYLQSNEQIEWADLLERDHDNFRAALQWCLDHNEIEIAGRLVESLKWFWHVHSHLSEGRRWYERILEQADDAPPQVRAGLLAGVGYYTRLLGESGQAARFIEGSIDLYRQLGDKVQLAENLRGLGMISYNISQFKRGNTLLVEALHLFEQLNNSWGQAMCLINLGRGSQEQGNYPQALQYIERGIEIGRKVDKVAAIYGTIGLGWVYLALGDWLEAEKLAAQSLYEAKEINNENLIAWCIWNQAGAALGQHQAERALKLAEESYLLWNRTDDEMGRALAFLRLSNAHLDLNHLDQSAADFRAGLKLWYTQQGLIHCCECLEGLAEVAVRQNNPAQAARWLGTACTLRESIGTPLAPAQQPNYDRLRSELESDPALRAAWLAGESVTLEEVVAEVLAETA